MFGQLYKVFGQFATLILAIYLPFVLWYWSMKISTQLYKKLFGLFGVKYPFNLKSGTELIIGALIIVVPLIIFQNLPSETYNRYALLPSVIGGLLVFSAIDKSILTNERVCDWFNKKRIWCD